MTGRELVIHILSNGLEDADISELFIAEEEAAVKLNVGIATVKTWASLGLIHCIVIDGKTYILPTKVLSSFEELTRKAYENNK